MAFIFIGLPWACKRKHLQSLATVLKNGDQSFKSILTRGCIYIISVQLIHQPSALQKANLVRLVWERLPSCHSWALSQSFIFQLSLSKRRQSLWFDVQDWISSGLWNFLHHLQYSGGALSAMSSRRPISKIFCRTLFPSPLRGFHAFEWKHWIRST